MSAAAFASHPTQALAEAIHGGPPDGASVAAAAHASAAMALRGWRMARAGARPDREAAAAVLAFALADWRRREFPEPRDRAAAERAVAALAEAGWTITDRGAA